MKRRQNMKNYRLIFILLSLILVLVGCTQPAATPTEEKPKENNVEVVDKPTDTPVETKNPESEQSEKTEEDVLWNEKFPKGNVANKQKIYDGNNIVINLNGVDYKNDSIYVIYEVENNRENSIEMGIERLSVDGVDYNNSYYRNVPAGKKALMVAFIYYRDMERVGIENIHSVVADFSFSDLISDEFEQMKNLKATTTLEAQQAKDPTETAELLYEDDYVAVWGIGLEENDMGYPGAYSSDIYYGLFIKNKVDQFLRFGIGEFTVNDYANDTYMYKEISNLGQGYAEIYISKFDLDLMGIEFPGGIKNLEFIVEAIDVGNYEVLHSSDRIKVEF